MSNLDAAGDYEDDEELDPVETDEELPGDDDEDPAPDEEVPVSTEDRARAMGWKPLAKDPRNPQPHEYRGDPRKWTDAETFIAHGEEELPILRDQNRRMSERLVRMGQEVETLKRTGAEQAQAIKDAMGLARRADERGYARAVAELKEKRTAAVETGDIETFNQLDAELAALEDTRAETAPATRTAPPPAKEPPPAPAPRIDPDVQSWIRDNVSWFQDRSRPYLNERMVHEHAQLVAANPGTPEGDWLDEAKARTARVFPEIMDGDQMPQSRTPAPPRPRRAAPSALAPSTGDGSDRRAPASPFDAITDIDERKEAKSAYERLKRMDPGLTAREYMVMYDNPHADALDLRAQRKK